jgi:hypothetical protein
MTFSSGYPITREGERKVYVANTFLLFDSRSRSRLSPLYCRLESAYVDIHQCTDTDPHQRTNLQIVSRVPRKVRTTLIYDIRLSSNGSRISSAISIGAASCSWKTLSMTDSSVLVVSIPVNAAQSFTTIPPPITGLPRLTVPAWTTVGQSVHRHPCTVPHARATRTRESAHHNRHLQQRRELVLIRNGCCWVHKSAHIAEDAVPEESTDRTRACERLHRVK